MLPILHIELEKWKYNKEYEVWVSTKGRVRDKKKKDVKPLMKANGYCIIPVTPRQTIYGLKTMILLHRLVLLTWKPIENHDNMTVDHLDHNKRNNSLNNLEWVTKEENERRAKSDLVVTVEVDPSKWPPIRVKISAEHISNIILKDNRPETVEAAYDRFKNCPYCKKKEFIRSINLILSGAAMKMAIPGSGILFEAVQV